MKTGEVGLIQQQALSLEKNINNTLAVCFNSSLQEAIKGNIMSYWYLAIAIVAEVIATSSLKASAEFTKLTPSLLVVIGYAVSLYFMMLVLRTMPVGITYAIWSGVGIVFVAIFSIFLYKQIPDLPAIIGMGLIIAGVVVIHLYSKTVGH